VNVRDAVSNVPELLRTRWAALLLGDLAMRTSQLFLQGRSGLARTFAGACIGAGTLAAH
jgi:hypothetical protein